MTTVQAEAAIGAVHTRHAPVANACASSVDLAAQLYLDSLTDADAMQLADAIGFGVASLGLLCKQLSMAVLDLELAVAAEERAVLDALMAEAE